MALLIDDSQEEKAHCLAAGASDYWVKPFRLVDRLIDQVAALVQDD
ncbi:MAG: hypothetical protein LH702_08625 [Phormidesmis sp. CAN_BIN44]|nr:hypothetical protein [Phormidesmis sp. CAN_BIN44]